MKRFLKSFLSVMAVALTSWTWAAAEVTYDWTDKSANQLYNFTNVLTIPESVTSFSVTVAYSDGWKRIEIAGMKLFDQAGNEIRGVTGTGASFAGGSKNNNVYTFEPSEGFSNSTYTLSAVFWVNGLNSHVGKMTLSNGVTFNGDLSVTQTGSITMPAQRLEGNEGDITIPSNFDLTVEGDVNGTAVSKNIVVSGTLRAKSGLTFTRGLSGAGQIVAEGEGSVLDLTSATVTNFTGTYSVGAGAALKLTLDQVTNKTVAADGGTVYVVLNALQQESEQTVTVSTSNNGVYQFVDANNNPLSRPNTTYVPSNDRTYNVATSTWDNGNVPSDFDNVVIAFGDAAGEVDLSTILGDVTALSKLTITGTNGGTITNVANVAICTAIVLETATTMPVELAARAYTIESTATLSIVGTEEETTVAGVISGNGQVKIAAGKVKFTNTNAYTGGTDIAAGATLTINNANALGPNQEGNEVSGAGILSMSVYPAVSTENYHAQTTIRGLNNANWTGCLRFESAEAITRDGMQLSLLGNVNSQIEIVEGTTLSGYFANSNWDLDATLILNGVLNVSDGFGDKVYKFTGPVTGNGTLELNASGTPNDTIRFTADTFSFAGAIAINKNRRSVVIGPEATSRVDGSIVIAKPVTIASGKTWTAVNGITITENGTLTISEARALPAAKAVSGAGALVINGTVDLSGITGALTCKLEVATDATVTITQAQAEAFASIEVNEGGLLNVIVAGKDISYTANVTGEGSVNIILANGTVLSNTATYKTPALTGDCTWLEFLFEGATDSSRLANGGTFGEAIRGEDRGTWTFVNVDVTPARQALQIHNTYPWTSTVPAFSSLKTWSASFFAKMPTTEGGILMGFGTTVGNNPGFIALVRGKGPDKVLLVSGTSSGRGYNILANFTVPNAESAYHLYTFVRTADGVNIYLDSEPWAPYGKTVTVGNGFQIGSLHGGYEGFTYSGDLTDYSGLTLTRGGSDTDTNGAVDMLRIYRFALSPEDVQTLASEYTYISPSGSYSREITMDATWTEDNAWTNEQNATTVSEPPTGSAVTLIADAEEKRTMTVNVSEAKAFEALTLQGTTIELIGAEGSKKLSVDGLTKVMCDATVDCGVIAMTGPVRVASGATLTLKVSEALLASVVQNAVIGKYTYHLTGSAEGNVSISNAVETYNGWSVKIEQDDTKSWVLTMTRANWYVSIDANNVTTWRAGNTVETAKEAAAPEMSTKHPIYVSVIGDASVTLPSGRTDNVTVSGSGRVTLNASANGTTIGTLKINESAMAAVTPALTVNQKTVAETATLGYAAAAEEWEITDALSGTTKIEIVAGTVKLTAANGGYEGQITVAKGATLASGTTATCPFGKGTSEGTIMNNGIVRLSGGQLPPTSGKGDVEISGLGEEQGDEPASIAGKLACTGTLRVAANQSVRLWHHQDDFTGKTPEIDGPSIDLGLNATIVAGDGYAETATMTIPATATLSGAGKIEIPLTLDNGATIDAKAGAVKVTGAVTLPTEEGETVKVKVAKYGDVLKAANLDAAKFTLADGQLLNSKFIATSDALVYAPVIQPAEDKPAISDAVMAEVARAAGVEGVTTVTAVKPAVIVDEKGDPILTVDVNGAELFNNVISFEDDGNSEIENAKIATVSYLFGVSDITVVKIDGKQYVVAELVVSNHADLEQNTAAYANGTTIDVTVKVGDVAQNVTVEEAAGMTGEAVAPAAELPVSTRYVRFPMPEGNGTFEIKARASKTTP